MLHKGCVWQTFFARQSQLIRENLTRTKSSTKLDNQNAKKSGKDQLKAGGASQESGDGGIVVTIAGRYLQKPNVSYAMRTCAAAEAFVKWLRLAVEIVHRSNYAVACCMKPW